MQESTPPCSQSMPNRNQKGTNRSSSNSRYRRQRLSGSVIARYQSPAAPAASLPSRIHARRKNIGQGASGEAGLGIEARIVGGGFSAVVQKSVRFAVFRIYDVAIEALHGGDDAGIALHMLVVPAQVV